MERPKNPLESSIEGGHMAHVVKTGSGKIGGMHEEGVLTFRGIP